MLGRSRLSVTPIGFGLAAIGRPAYINLERKSDLPPGRTLEELRSRSEELLDEAFRLGIRYFDAARSYGLGEQFLGSWLSSRQPLPEPVTCGSKWGYTYVGEWRMDAPVQELKDHSLATLTRQYRESRELLGQWLSLYEIHSATFESGVLENEEVLRELLRLSRGGLAIGLSVSGPRQGEVLRRALEVELEGENPFSVVQATWNLLEPSAGPALAEAHAAGLGVLIKEALANGRLLRPDDARMAPLQLLALELGVRPDAVCLAAALAQPFCDVVLSGAVTTSQLGSNAEADRLGLDQGQLERLADLAVTPQRYWSERSRLPWS